MEHGFACPPNNDGAPQRRNEMQFGETQTSSAGADDWRLPSEIFFGECSDGQSCHFGGTDYGASLVVGNCGEGLLEYLADSNKF